MGISFSCDVMEITLLVFLQGCVRDEWDLSSSTESVLTSVVFAGIFTFTFKTVCINILRHAEQYKYCDAKYFTVEQKYILSKLVYNDLYDFTIQCKEYQSVQYKYR